MKIIGKANGSYLVTMNEGELAKAVGFAYIHDDFWQELRRIGAARKPGYGANNEIVEGVEIPLSQIFDRLSELRRAEVEVKKKAQSLRALADLMDGNLPTASVSKEAPATEVAQ